MGVLIFYQWGRLLAMASAAYMMWASFWAFFYRKFFWDMIGAELGPAGLIPPPSANFFLAIIVNLPLLQVFTLLISVVTVAIELPLPILANTPIHRSMHFRAVLYFFAAFFGMLIYQTVDCAVYYFITCLVYVRAIFKGEIMKAGIMQSNGGEA